jgi:hypothetical protein
MMFLVESQADQGVGDVVDDVETATVQTIIQVIKLKT